MPKLANKSVYLRLAIIFLILAAVASAVVLSGHSSPKTKSAAPGNVSACGSYRTDTHVAIYGQTLSTEVPANSDQFAKGLGGRPCILPTQAMLFGFKKPGHYAFWMKDMKFPIDIVWIGADHKVAGLEVNVKPSTYPDRFINKDTVAQYVLEIKANRSKDLHISIGTPIQF